MTPDQLTTINNGAKKMISDKAREELKEIAREILDARTDAEFAEAVRAMHACLEHYSIEAA